LHWTHWLRWLHHPVSSRRRLRCVQGRCLGLHAPTNRRARPLTKRTIALPATTGSRCRKRWNSYRMSCTSFAPQFGRHCVRLCMPFPRLTFSLGQTLLTILSPWLQRCSLSGPCLLLQMLFVCLQASLRLALCLTSLWKTFPALFSLILLILQRMFGERLRDLLLWLVKTLLCLWRLL